MEIGLQRASKKYKVSQQALLLAVRRGALHAITVPVLQLRFRHRDIEAFLATIPEWRRNAGRKGAATKWRNYRARQAQAAADSARRQPA